MPRSVGGAGSIWNVAAPSVERYITEPSPTLPASNIAPDGVRTNAVITPAASTTGDVAVAPPSSVIASRSPFASATRRKTRAAFTGSTAIRLKLRTPAPSAAVRSRSCQVTPPSVDLPSLGTAGDPLISVRYIVAGAERALSIPVTMSPLAAV